MYTRQRIDTRINSSFCFVLSLRVLSDKIDESMVVGGVRSGFTTPFGVSDLDTIVKILMKFEKDQERLDLGENNEVGCV